MTKATETILKTEALSELPRLLAGSRRALIITGPSRRFVDRVTAHTGDIATEVFAGAEVHVPERVVREAAARVEAFAPDVFITVGGGAAVGLAKALRLEHDTRFIAIPTTYAGSEMTSIYGISSGSDKKTGRDERVRPDAVIYDPALTSDMPGRLTTESLLNALAHPVSALSTGSLDAATRARALRAVDTLFGALEHLLVAPRLPEARLAALRGASQAAAVLDAGTLGEHHELAHFLGGRFKLPHSSLHAVLLPHTIARLAREHAAIYAELSRAAGPHDLAAALFDALRRAGAPTSLRELGVDEVALTEALSRDSAKAEIVRDALFGRRPSIDARRQDWGLDEPVHLIGPAIDRARKVVVAIHGRGSDAGSFLQRVDEITGDAPDVAVVAPQAPGDTWYRAAYAAPREELDEELDRALAAIDRVVRRAREAAGAANVVLLGFSQGACLASEYLARHGAGLGGLIAFAGARVGEPWTQAEPDLAGTRVLLGVAAEDAWLRPDHVEATARFFSDAGANVSTVNAPGSEHGITALQRIAARELLLGPRRGPAGFGNAHHSEALPGALPGRQNSPRRTRYGLYAEQINASGFGAARHDNFRAWLYRVRPSAQHSRFVPVDHPTLTTDFMHGRPDPNLAGYAPLAFPDEPTDFVDGLATFGGAGSPSLRRGFAIHLYVANRSMDDRAFYNRDGELLLIPQEGAITLLTELGVLEVAPGSLAIVPQGLKFSVLLPAGRARGYVAEIYGRRFELPERGPVGANGLSDARHFRAPHAWHENRLAIGYRITAKFAGELFDAEQDYSPYDVVAWHGNHAPSVYDLLDFCPVSNVAFDHPDPSIYTVLSAPLDEQGSNTLDFVFFPPRTDATEDTFRPPYFHRNATTEYNGIIVDPAGTTPPFLAGGYFITPSLTAHGVLARSVERSLRAKDPEPPQRFTANAMWFQFETALPLIMTKWARNSANRIADWPDIWGAYRTRYAPRSEGVER